MSKNKNQLSGSVENAQDHLEKDDYESVDDMRLDVEEIEKALTKLLGSEVKDILELEASFPIFVLNLDSESEFFYSMNRKTFVQIRNGTEVMPVFEDPKKQNPVPGFYVINNEIFNIDIKKVICLGWN